MSKKFHSQSSLANSARSNTFSQRDNFLDNYTIPFDPISEVFNEVTSTNHFVGLSESHVHNPTYSYGKAEIDKFY
jgi:hypothetical protein